MEKVEEYKRLAAQARQKADATEDKNLKRQLLEVANEWEMLAEARESVLILKGEKIRRRENGHEQH